MKRVAWTAAAIGLAALFLVTRSAPTACVNSSGAWQSFPFTSQAGAFTFDADLTPLAQGLDSLVCLSKGAPTGVTSCAVILRFATDNQIDARDGGAYADLDGPTGQPYVAGNLYGVTLFVDVAAHKFDVAIGGVIATPHPFAFRTEQANVTSLDTWSVRRISGTGSHETCGGTVNQPPAGQECDPCASSTLGAPAACATWTQDMELSKADGWVVLARETGGQWVPVIQRPWVKYQSGGGTVCAGYGFTPEGALPAGCDKMLVLPHAPLTRWWTPTPGKLYDLTFRLYKADATPQYQPGPTVQNVEPMPSDCGGEGHRWETICGPNLWPSGKCP